MPMHLRRKLRPEKARPRNFEMMPPLGMLLPGQRVNVQVKFMPTEEVRFCHQFSEWFLIYPIDTSDLEL